MVRPCLLNALCWGGILAVMLGTAVFAQGPTTQTRPQSRADAFVLRAETALARAEDARLAQIAALAEAPRWCAPFI
jgi:hypothetical protein